MTFQEKIQEFRKLAAERKDYVKSEEATKTSLVMPFFQQVLGYDVFSPTEFIPEYKAGFGDKPTDRVDYTIMLNGNPVIIVECKSRENTLNVQHEAQLQGYFASLKAKIAILTNGIVYKFYTDIERANLLDKTPFMTFDLLNHDDSLINELERFCRDNFNADEIFESSRVLKYKSAIKNFLYEQLAEPSEVFVKAVISRIGEADTRKEALEEFKPLVKTCLAEFINENSANKLIVEDTEPQVENDVEQEVLTAIRACVKDVIEPMRLSLYRVKKWTSVYYRNCVLCKIFTIDKDYCEIVFPEKFSDPKTNWKSRKHDITYSLSSVDEVPNYKDDFIASAKDIDASYDIIHQKK